MTVFSLQYVHPRCTCSIQRLVNNALHPVACVYQCLHLVDMCVTERGAMRLDVQETLQQMLQQLDICQKALSNFLEDKRSAFPRFYFIGDDDLLEVLIKSSWLLCNLYRLVYIGTHHLAIYFSNNSFDSSSFMKLVCSMPMSGKVWAACKLLVRLAT